jgi:hypothetical protein
VLVALAIATVLAGAAVYAGFILYMYFPSNSQPMASIGGCPSSAFPLRPSSSLDSEAGLVGDWPPRDLGCWTTYSEDGSANDVSAYYLNPANTPGWTLVYNYPQTGEFRFKYVANPVLQARVSVGGIPSIGHTKTRLDISLCFCDPDKFAG